MGIWAYTEMLTDGIIDLYEAGLVTGAASGSIRAHGLHLSAGLKRQYDAIHKNKDILSYAVDYTNLPHNVMQNDKVVSINNTTQMDLQGQAASELWPPAYQRHRRAVCSSCAAPMPRRAASRSSACRRPMTRRATRRAASFWPHLR